MHLGGARTCVLCGKECICIVYLYYLAGFLRGAGADILKGP